MSKTYGTRGVAEPHNHLVYDTYIKALGLKDNERIDLKKRGLIEEHIKAAGYATKQINTAKDTFDALGKLKTLGLNLDTVPGFYVNDKTGHSDQCKVSGLIIPVRDYNGHISSLLCRNDKAKIGKDGKIENKYIAFSSSGKTKGNRVRQTTHCPIIKGKATACDSTSIRITEGVLKADVATALGDKYCLGMQGLNIQDDLAVILTQIEIQELIISLDAGEDDNFDILRCKAKLIKLCGELGIDFKIEIWDVKYGKGIDDVIHSQNSDKIKYATEDEIASILDKANEADYNNGEWIYNIHDQAFVNIITSQELNKSQFVDKFRLEKMEYSNKVIASGFKQVDKTAFLPKGDLFINENGLKCLNTWKDPNITPADGDVSPFINHMRFLFPDDHQFDMVMNWLAHNIQFPGIKILWALVMIGDEGIGKSFFGWLMKRLLGISNVGSPSNEQIHEQWTDWQKNKCLIIIEELMAKGKIDLMNKLKPMITEPTTQIREMRKTAYEAPNRFNILAFTNYKDSLLLGDKDRRYGITESLVTKRDRGYYIDLWEWAKKPESIQAIYHYFMSRDLRSFDPNAEPPETISKSEMIMMSLTPLEEWIKSGFEERFWPFNRDILIIRHIRKKGMCPDGLDRLSPIKWSDTFKKYGAIKYEKQIRLSDKSTAWSWLIGDQKIILSGLSPPEISKRYESTSLDYTSQTPLELEKFESNIITLNNESNPIKDDEPL